MDKMPLLNLQKAKIVIIFISKVKKSNTLCSCNQVNYDKLIK